MTMAASEANLDSSELLDDSMMTAIMNGTETDDKEVLAYVNRGDNAWTLWLHALSLIDESNDFLSAVRLLNWCVRSDALSDDASVHSTHLQLLYELGRYDDIHSQCSQMTCCLAAEVVHNMVREQQKSLKQALEVFVLQDLLSPERLCCTQKLLEAWFEALIVEIEEIEEIIENVNKMMAIAETSEQKITFLRAMILKFGSKLLPLCASLALRLFQQLRLQASTSKADRKKSITDLADSCELVSQLHPATALQLSCLQSANHLFPTAERALLISKYQDGISDHKHQPLVSNDLYNQLLRVVDSLREPGFGLHGEPSRFFKTESVFEDIKLSSSDVTSDVAKPHVEVRTASEDSLSKKEIEETNMLCKRGDIDVRLGSEAGSENEAETKVVALDSDSEPELCNKRFAIRIQNSFKKANYTKQIFSEHSVTRENRFFKTKKTRVGSRKVAACSFDFEDEADLVSNVRGRAKTVENSSLVKDEVVRRNRTAVSDSTRFSSNDAVKMGKITSLLGSELKNERGSYGKSKASRQLKDSCERQTADSVVVKKERDQWNSVVETAGGSCSEGEQGNKHCAEDSDVNSKETSHIRPSSNCVKSSKNKDIWMPYQERKSRRAPKKLILKRRRCSDIDGESIKRSRKSDSSESSEGLQGRAMVNGKKKSNSESKVQDVGKPISRRRHNSSEKKSVISGKNGVCLVEEPVQEELVTKDLAIVIDTKSDINSLETATLDDSLQTRQTNEEVFRKISREAGSGLACRYCKRELRTRAQLMRHANGACAKKTSPNQSDGESNDSTQPTPALRQRCLSDVVSVSVQRCERGRRHTIEIPNLEADIDGKPHVVDVLDLKPDVNAVLSPQSGVELMEIEITPLTKIQDVSMPKEDESVKVECLKSETSTPLTESSLIMVDVSSHSSPSSDKVPMPQDTKFDLTEATASQVCGLTSDLASPRLLTVVPLCIPSDSSVQCVCDGCGEVVPDCSWLTAHIVTCPGRSGAIDEIVNEGAEPEAETPQWSNGQPVKDTTNESTVADDANSAATAKVDAAGLLQLLRSVENSLLYGNSTVDASGVAEDVIDTSDVINRVDQNKSSPDLILPEDGKDKDFGAIGRVICYNGVEMYEFSEYKCNGCPLTFSEKTSAERHASYAIDHSGSAIQRQPIYVCMHCDLRCRQQRLVWFHVTYICHKPIIDETEDIAQPAEDLYRCTMCSKLFFARDYLRRHIHLNHPSAVEISAAEASSTPTNGSHFGLATQLLSDWSDYCPAPDGVDGKQVSSNANSHQQALLDLACSMVLDGICPVSSAGMESTASAASSSALQAQSAASSLPIRRTAKGIVYKNVFMQCIVSYICSNCSRDLSAKSAKRDHRALAPPTCFDAGPGGRRLFTYVRHYTYLCPYCGDRAATQKACRAHQLTVCLPRMGVKTDELNHKQLLCPFCQRKYFNIITLKGHMTLVHQVSRAESAALIANATGGIIGEELLGLLPEGSILSGMSALSGSDGKLNQKGLAGKGTAKRPPKVANDGNGLVPEKRSKENEDDGFAEDDVDSYASGSVSQDSHFETVDPSASLFTSKMSNHSPVLEEDELAEKNNGETVSSPNDLVSTQSRSIFRRRPPSTWQRSKRKLVAKPHKKTCRKTT